MSSRSLPSAILVALVSLVTRMALAAPPAALPATQPARVLPPGQTQADLTAYLLKRVPKLSLPKDAKGAAAWPREAERIRREMLEKVVLKGVPESWTAGDVKVVWLDTLDGPEYVVRKLRFQAVPGLWIGALLYEPKGLTKPVPAVLSVNGHVLRGITTDYEQIRCINIAKRGMLALHPEWIGMGQLNENHGYGHADIASLDLCGTAGVSLFYLELKRAMDVLLAHKHADPQRVAMTGLSGGGWQTIFFSSLDSRVRLAVPNAGYIGFEERIRYPADTGDLEQNMTDLMTVADYPMLTAMLAPRPALLIYNEKDDCCFPAARAKASVYDPIVPLYGLLGAADDFAFHVNSDPGTHNYLKDNRQAFYRFINRHFLPESERRDEEIPAEAEVRKPEQVRIEYPKGNADIHALAAELMSSLPRRGGDLKRVIHCTAEPVAEGGALERQIAPQPGVRARVMVVSGGVWHVPVVEYTPKETPTDFALVIADQGWTAAEPIVRELMEDGRTYVAVTNLLFTGECQPDAGAAWTAAQMIGAAGERPLGIQVSQVAEVLERLAVEQARVWKLPAGRPRFHVVTAGRVSGLAVLTMAAAHLPAGQDRIAGLELRGMIASLKELIEKRVRYLDAPSLFCFGLLETADVKDMIAMAAPVKVALKAQ